MNSTKLSRRFFLKSIGISTTAVVLGDGVLACSKVKKPNVLFMAIDDLNDWIGCLGGHPQAKTPNLDRLAAKGVLFENAFCAAPACNPSRAALLTGIRPASSGVYLNPQVWRDSPVLKDAVTLPQYFMENGYTAIASGKIYHGRYPDPPSWDEYWPSQQKNKPDDPVPENRPINGIPKTSHFDWGVVDVPPQQMGDWQVADWVIEKLNKSFDKPLFLGCGFFRPHLPWYVPQKYFDMFPLQDIILPNVKKNDLDDLPEAGKKMAKSNRDHLNVTEYDQWKQAVQGYLASITFVDECVGRVIDAFEKSEYKDNTVIVLWSDHGWHLGEKLHWRKFSLWEEATHNVMMWVAPGVTTAGGSCASPVNLLDIYPTLVDLCGLPPKKELEGNSLVPLLKDPKTEWNIPSLTSHGYQNHCIRSQQWRYIRYKDGSEELYDRAADPMEWTNLINNPQYGNVVEEHKKWLPKVYVDSIPRDPNV
jgi:arylsulfatase A-like enzyme